MSNNANSDTLSWAHPSEFKVKRSERQRREIDTSDLDESVRLRGVLVPILVRMEPGEPWLYIVAGERRWTSASKVGRTSIPYRLFSELDPVEQRVIELEENLKRQDLPWRDLVKAVGEIHELYTTRKAGDWTKVQTAASLGLQISWISVVLRVYSDLDSPKLAAATGIRAAYNLLARADERKVDAVMGDLMEASLGIAAEAEPMTAPPAPPPSQPKIPGQVSAPAPAPAPAPVPAPRPTIIPSDQSIFNTDFVSWAPNYSGPKFNFLHCDFPYGINAFDGSQGVGAASSADIDLESAQAQLYSDNPEVYWQLMECLCTNLDRLLAPKAHMMFWFSMHYYSETLDFFRRNAPSLEFYSIPLIWHKTDNRGVISDARRRPRNVYETCLMASRGDRLIVKSVSNVYGAPTDKTYHHSTKPEPMLRALMAMFVDETTRMLDPTCGSGSSLRAAESLGASHVMGLEVNPDHCINAREALRKFRVLRLQSKETSPNAAT